MPNWCEGKLKIRGKKSDLLKWLMECVACWKQDVLPDVPFPNNLVERKAPNGVSVEFPLDDEAHIRIKELAYIDGTHRNFVKKCDSDVIFGAKDGRDIMVLPVQAAWAMDPTPYETMSEKYNVDFRFYGYEQGMEFNQEIEVIGGKLTLNRTIDYSDYRWECPDPDLGG